MIPNALERAVAVLKTNSYMVLATADAAGPWAAALAYTLMPDSSLCFVSQATSRHGSAIARDNAVAGVIFNSQAATEDVESIQFAGMGRTVLESSRIRAVLSVNGGNPDDAEVERLATGSPAAMYEIKVTESYVLDQQAWLDHGVDAREPVDFPEAVARLRAQPVDSRPVQ